MARSISYYIEGELNTNGQDLNSRSKVEVVYDNTAESWYDMPRVDPAKHNKKKVHFDLSNQAASIVLKQPNSTTKGCTQNQLTDQVVQSVSSLPDGHVDSVNQNEPNGSSNGSMALFQQPFQYSIG